MTQESSGKIGLGKLLLGAAILALSGAVGYSLSNRSNTLPTSVPSDATQGALTDTLDQLKAKAQADPTNPGAWQALGYAYFVAGRFAEAVGAYKSAVDANGSQAVLWSSLGEAQVMASERDPMPAEALVNFRKAVAIDPKDPRARYFLAVKRDLDGDHQGALADWLALLADTPKGAPWEADLRRTIEQVGKINKIDIANRMASVKQPETAGVPLAARAIPGPSADDLAAASKIPPSQQQEMVNGMVARLEGRLKADPANVDGWVMLMRSRVTLGQNDKASAALQAAVAANPARAQYLRQQAQILGVK